MTPEQNILRFAQTGDERALHTAMLDISVSIANAINPISAATAPLVIYVLRAYADSIGNNFDGAAEAAKDFEGMPQVAVAIPVKSKK